MGKEVEDSPEPARQGGELLRHELPAAAAVRHQRAVCQPVVAVEFPEGINIIGMMEDCTPDEVRIGMDVEVTAALYTNKKDEEIIAWKFKAV